MALCYMVMAHLAHDRVGDRLRKRLKCVEETRRGIHRHPHLRVGQSRKQRATSQRLKIYSKSHQ